MVQDKTTELTISLPLFDGPMDLLISLIRRNQWPIEDLPVLVITAQFLAYVRAAKDLDAELAGEFVETASWLVLLKSRSLLPAELVDGPAPREELTRAVLEHVTLAATKDLLRDRYERSLPLGSTGSPAGREKARPDSANEDGATLEDLLDAARQAMEAARAAASLRGSAVDAVTVEDQIEWIARELDTVPDQAVVSTAGWFEAQSSAEARIALLLALLELSGKGFVLLHQREDFAAIQLKAKNKIPIEMAPSLIGE